MQCTSFTPVYYHARDLNVGASGYSWHLCDSNASYGDGGGYNISVPLCDQFSVYDKEVLKQIIQNHEATFRYQVQELHRLYRRQRDLMDEMRMREIFAHHLHSRTSESFHSLSYIGDEFSQNRSSATNRIFGNLESTKLSELTSVSVQGHNSVVAEKLDKPTTLHTDSFIRKNSINDVQFLSPSCKQTGTEIAALNLKQFELGNLSEAPELNCCTMAEISSFQPARGSDFASIKSRDFSSSNSNIRKTNCFIDLNEPIQLESFSASSSGPLEAFTGHNKTVCSDKCVPVKAIPESIVPTQSQLLKSDDNWTDGVNSSMAIDLNSMPVNCYYETDMTLNSPRSMSKDSSGYNHAMRNRKRSEDELKKSDNFLETERYIDLNTGLVDEHSLPLPSSTLQIKSAEDTELKGPVSPENEESYPPRGKSEDIQLETPHSSEQGEGEPLIEVDTIAAQTLVNMVAALFDSQTNFRNLFWFAEFVSSTGDDLESEVIELEKDLCENDLHSSHFIKSKGTGTMSRRSGKGQKRGKKRRKNFQTEEALGSRGCPKTKTKTNQLKRKAGKNGCAKPRKYSKLSPSEVTKKSRSSILKQSTARMNQDVLQSWGNIRKRQGGRRRRASNSFSLANLASF